MKEYYLGVLVGLLVAFGFIYFFCHCSAIPKAKTHWIELPYGNIDSVKVIPYGPDKDTSFYIKYTK